jgi:hypothetical protein
LVRAADIAGLLVSTCGSLDSESLQESALFILIFLCPGFTDVEPSVDGQPWKLVEVLLAFGTAKEHVQDSLARRQLDQQCSLARGASLLKRGKSKILF